MADNIISVIIEAKNLASTQIAEVSGSLGELQAQSVTTGAAMAGVGLAAVGIAAGLAAGVGELSKQAAAYQSTLVTIQNNTGLTDQNVTQLHDGILKLASDTGAPIDQIAHAFEHAMNVTQNYTAAMAEAQAGTESAVSTGASATDVVNMLSSVMHEYSLDVSKAATEQGRYNEILTNSNKVMGELHIGAQLANTTLGQYTEAQTRAIGIAAAMGVALTDVLAATSSLTKHGFPDVDQAGTQVTNMLTHMLNPGAAAKKALDELAKASGESGVAKAFDAGNLAARGFAGTIDYLKEAEDKSGMSTAELEKLNLRIIPALRGGLGFASLLSTGYQDMNGNLVKLNDTTAVQAVTQDSFNRTLGTAVGQWNVFKESMHAAAITLGEAFLPATLSLTAAIRPVVEGVVAWAVAHKELLAQVVPVVVAITGIAGVALVTAAAIGALVAAFNPLTLVILGVIGAAAALGALFAGPIKQALGGDFEGALHSAGTNLAGFGATIKGAATQWIDALGDWLTWVGGGGRLWLEGSLDEWKMLFVDWITKTTAPLLIRANQLLNDLVAWVTGPAGALISATIDEWRLRQDTATEALNIKQGFLDQIAQLPPKSKVHAQELRNQMAQELLGLQQDSQTVAQGIKDDMHGQLALAVIQSRDDASGLRTAVHDQLIQLHQAVATEALGMREDVSGQAQQMRDDLQKKIADMRAGAVGDTKEMRAEVERHITQMRITVGDQIAQLRTGTSADLAGMQTTGSLSMQTLQTTGVQSITTMQTGVSGQMTTMLQLFQQVMNQMLSQFTGSMGNMVTVGATLGAQLGQATTRAFQANLNLSVPGGGGGMGPAPVVSGAQLSQVASGLGGGIITSADLSQAAASWGSGGNAAGNVGLSTTLESHAAGGVVGGAFGEARLIIAHGGETVIPNGRSSGDSTSELHVHVHLTGNVMTERDLVEVVHSGLLKKLRGMPTLGFR